MSIQQIVGADALAHLVHERTLRGICDIGDEVMLELLPTVEGLLRVVAQLVVETGALQSKQAEDHFADHVRDTLLNQIREAEKRAPAERWAYRVASSESVN